MMFTIEELYCLHTMNKKRGAIPGLVDLYADKSKLEIRKLFKVGQDKLVERGLGKDNEISQLIIGHGALLDVYTDQQDFMIIDNVVFETSNNQILAITCIEEEGMYDFGIQYKGLLFTKLLNNYKTLLAPYTQSEKSVQYSEKCIKEIDYPTFVQEYSDFQEALFMKRIEADTVEFSRIIFGHGFSVHQYDFLTNQIKEVKQVVMAHQLYQWMNITELEYSREEIQALAQRMQKREKI